MLEAFAGHVKHAARLIGRSPVFALTSIVSVALGIGATTAIFTIANGLLLAPTAGVRDPSRLVDIGRAVSGSGFDTVSYQTYADLLQREAVFEGVLAIELEPQPLSLGEQDGAERIYGEMVSASYFDVLGLQPSAGAFFHATEEQIGVPLRKVVLSHAFWQSHFNSRTDMVGETLLLNGDPFTVVAVGPAGYHGTTILVPDVWVPLTGGAKGMPSDSMLRGRENQWLIMAGRLKPGVSVAGAQAYVETFAADLRRLHPDTQSQLALTVVPASRIPAFGTQVVGPFLGLLMGAAGLVLLVTCLNLTGLLLARSAGRSRDVAVRLALGASRRSLGAMLMVETGLIFAMGAAAALAVAVGMTRLLASVLTTLPFPVTVDLSIDWRVLTFTAGVALVASLLTGVAPAWQSARTNLVPDLKNDASARRRQRLRRAFITAQLAFCLVLVATAGLFARALGAAANVSPGFDVDPIDVAALDLRLGGYTDEQSPLVAEQIRDRLAAIPGVQAVGFARMVALDGGGLGLGGLRRKGTTGRDAELDTDWNVVSPGYLTAIGIPLTRGRLFTADDRQNTPGVAIVNEHLAKAVWPGEEAIGQVLEYGDLRPGRESSVETLTVIGVARDAKYRWIGEAPAPFIYVPYAQHPMREVNYFIRRAGGGAAADSVAAGAPLLPAVRHALRAFDPNLPLVRLQPLRASADLGLLPQRVAATVAGSLGSLALLLAGIGVYGVTAFAVASRTREIGVRMALGADRARVMRMVFAQGVRLAAIGGSIGVAMAIGVAQLISSLLFGVSPLDPTTYVATFGVLAGVTLAATLVPARRAAAVDPLTSLRSE